MKNFSNFILGIVVLVVASGVFFYAEKWEHRKSASEIIEYDDVRKRKWSADFQKVDIPSSLDGAVQEAWFFSSPSDQKQPLLVSLHTWSGDFNQKDTLAQMAVEAGWNYIHPNFRGPNWTDKACCSEWALQDIDDAIAFAIQQGNVDLERIKVVGVSGGGYASLAVYMRSKHQIESISAWVPISDLEAWYNETALRGLHYADHILQCTGSSGTLDLAKARERSPLFWEVPKRNTKLRIFAGVNDGIKGSVPITHSINFYNKLIKANGEATNNNWVSPEETLFLLEKRRPYADFGQIGDRAICLQKEFQNLSLTIFMGGHEMLPEPCFTQLSTE